jgi:hypothetical protein
MASNADDLEDNLQVADGDWVDAVKRTGRFEQVSLPDFQRLEIPSPNRWTSAQSKRLLVSFGPLEMISVIARGVFWSITVSEETRDLQSNAIARDLVRQATCWVHVATDAPARPFRSTFNPDITFHSEDSSWKGHLERWIGEHYLDGKNDQPAVVSKAISVPPQQASTLAGILMFFGEYLREQRVDDSASVSVEQVGRTLRLTIRPSEHGKIRRIERSLDEYAMLLHGEAGAWASLSPYAALTLRNKLEVAQAEIRMLDRTNAFLQSQLRSITSIAGDLATTSSRLNMEQHELLATHTRRNAVLLDRLVELLNVPGLSSDGRSAMEQLVQIGREDKLPSAVNSDRMFELLRQEEPAVLRSLLASAHELTREIGKGVATSIGQDWVLSFLERLRMLI